VGEEGIEGGRREDGGMEGWREVPREQSDWGGSGMGKVGCTSVGGVLCPGLGEDLDEGLVSGGHPLNWVQVGFLA